MNKQLAINAFTVARPYDWYPLTWAFHALVLALELESYPNAPLSLQARIDLRKN